MSSARAITREHGSSYVRFVLAQSRAHREAVLALPFGGDTLERFERLAARSLEEQRALEIGDTLSFEDWRQAYLAPVRLR